MNDPINNILIITSSGGGGHLQAAHAKRLELMRQSSHAQIIERDILIDWVNKHIGHLFTGMWNKAQTSGNVKRLHQLYRLKPLADFIFWVPIFLAALFTFMHHDIQRVFDTQPLGTSALIWAMRAYRKICGKKLVLEKLLSDLPTEKAIHFFAPIKKLTTNNKKLIKVLTSKPLLSEGQTERDFWKTHCKLDLENIQYQTAPIRPGFQKYRHHKQSDKLLSLRLKTHNHHERFLMEDTLLKGSIHAIIKENVIQVSIKPDEVVLTLMLGSQPNHVATLGYIQNFIELARENKQKYHVFVFCNHHKNQNKSLLRKVHQMIQATENYPVNLSIIPMGIQDDTVIAPLFYRSNATLTRSGGLTSMELLATGKGKIWIHADDDQVQGFFDGMPIWEKGNAEYLMNHLSAKIITPSKFHKFIAELE